MNPKSFRPDNEPEFRSALKNAERVLQSKMERLDLLRKSRTVVIYGYGTRGQSLAKQLRFAGVNPIICDSDVAARNRASAAGYETIIEIDARLPLVIGAAQNQIALLNRFPGAYSLVECLYSYDLVNQCAKAGMFTDNLDDQIEEIYSIYQSLDETSQKALFDVLMFRGSLDVFQVDKSRVPMAEMWGLPLEHLQISSFCDAGAYDGDTIRFVAQRTDLKRALTIEPNSRLEDQIVATAKECKVDLKHFNGGLWSHRCYLRAIELSGGMIAVEEDQIGSIRADTLDSIALGQYDYVKFDIEGAEEVAMSSARFVLTNAKAVALAAYHRPDDIFRVPKLLVDIRHEAGCLKPPDARLHFRHYSECFDDSIFYYY